MQKLSFNKSLVSTVKNPLSTKDLLVRLEDLYNELSSMDQDDVDLSSLKKVRTQLATKRLIHNSNRGVQAFVSCCLVDILRLTAPDAPYNATELSQIFRLFFRQIKLLSDTDSGYYQQYIYLVTRIAEVKIAVLLTDLPDKSKLTDGMFESVYTAVCTSDETVYKNLETIFLELLTEVITESNQIPDKSMKMMLNKFLQHIKLAKKRGSSIPGFAFTVKLFTLNADRMSRFVTIFFSDMLYKTIKSFEQNKHQIDEDMQDSDDESIDDHLANDDMQQLKKVHLIIIEIWKYVPEVDTSIIGLISNELEAEDESIRVLATEVVGRILSISPTPVSFADEHKETFGKWIKRPLDRSVEVRKSWMKSALKVLQKQPTICQQVSGGVLKLLVDTNASVRLSTLTQLRQVKGSEFMEHLNTQSMMKTLFQLMREKHSEIRHVSIQLLANLYNQVFSGLNTADDHKLIRNIPEQILNLTYINSEEVRKEMDFALFEYIFPREDDDIKRVNRLVTVVASLSPKARSAFYAIIRRQTQLGAVLRKLLDIAEVYDGGADDTAEIKLDRGINWFNGNMPSDLNYGVILKAFFTYNNARMLRLLHIMLSTLNFDYSDMYNALSELIDKLSESDISNVVGIDNTLTTAQIVKGFKLICYRSCPLLYNKSNVSELLKISREDGELQKAASDLISSMSELTPEILKGNISDLIDSVCQRTAGKSIDNDLIAINNFVKKFPDVMNDQLSESSTQMSDVGDGSFFEKLVQMGVNGTPTEAKYSVRILSSSHISLKEAYIQEIIDKISVPKLASINLNTQLTSISEILMVDISLLESKLNDLSKFLLSNLLLHNNLPSDIQETGWISDESLLTTPEGIACNSKLISLTIFVNWLKAIKDDDTISVDKVADPIIGLLNSIINNGGEIVPQKDSTYPTKNNIKSRLRLEAGLQIIGLGKYDSYDRKLTQSVLKELIFLIQDEDVHVRRSILKSLCENLTENKLMKRFAPLVFFFAQDPEKEIKDQTAKWIRAALVREITSGTSNDDLTFEASYVRFIYMLSHHQKFEELFEAYNQASMDEKRQSFLELAKFALVYLVYALGLITTQNSISLLFYLTQRIKQYEDVELDNTSNDRLYLLSDLAQQVIQRISDIRTWNITTWSGKYALPADLFIKNRDRKQVHDVILSTYIPDEYSEDTSRLVQSQCSGLPKPLITKALKKRKVNDVGSVTKRLPSVTSNRRDTIATRLTGYGE